MSKAERIAELIFHFLRNDLNSEQQAELDGWRNASPENESFFQKETNLDNIREDLKEMYAVKDKVWANLVEKMPELSAPLHPQKRISWKTIAAVAATIILALGTGIYFWLNRTKTEMTNKPVATNKSEIHPGGDHATLTLANGKTILLDTVKLGKFHGADFTNITKNDSGEISYKELASSSSSSVAYNLLSTPRGGQFKVVLPDGSQVWLNASSSLRYPVTFDQSSRKVALMGEAYFEVAKSKTPFIVSISDNAKVEVLGTHFDIMSYFDEPSIKTTLLEGSIRLTKGTESKLIKPGQQAIYAIETSPTSMASSPIQIQDNIDLSGVIAWKNGRTFFKEASIPSIMRTVSRWYDVEIKYEGTPEPRKITGAFSRQATLSELLQVFTINDIHYRLDGKTIIIKP